MNKREKKKNGDEGEAAGMLLSTIVGIFKPGCPALTSKTKSEGGGGEGNLSLLPFPLLEAMLHIYVIPAIVLAGMAI